MARARRKTRAATASEHTEQVALFYWARFQQHRYPGLELMHAIPNGGDRHPAGAAKLKSEGVKAGVPDIFLPVPRGKYPGLYIEMKTATGTVSEKQHAWLGALRRQGYRAEVCRGWQEAIQVITNYLGELEI